MLLTSGSALTGPFGPESRDTAVDTWRERWERWCGRGVSTLREAYSEMDLPFVRFGEEEGYQQRLALLVPEVRH